MTTILHASDLHFGEPAILDQVEGLVDDIQASPPDLVALSGDFSQRARIGEFQAASLVIRRIEKIAPTISVPGNHDVAWWFAPVDIGVQSMKLANYRKYLNQDIEPVVNLPGLFVAGLNTSHGITQRTLTKRPRDLSIIGDVTPEQLRLLDYRAKEAPQGAARVAVMHHNPVRGELSQRYGMQHHRELLDRLAQNRFEVVLCGHDHQESVTRTDNGMVVSIAGTLSNRSRGGRPSSYHMVTISDTHIHVVTHAWTQQARRFTPTTEHSFARVLNG